MKTLRRILTLFWLAAPGYAADIENGDALHFEHCTGCHDDGVYTRENRNLRSFERLGQQLRFCKDTIGLAWFDEDVDDVVEYLDRSYYHFNQAGSPAGSD